MGNTIKTIYEKSRESISKSELKAAYKLLLAKHPKDENLLLLSSQFHLCENEYRNLLISFADYKLCIFPNAKALLLYTNKLERSYSELNSRNFLLSVRK